MKSQTGNKNYQKLRNAIDSLKASNEKINPSSVEKKAGVGNGALAYYTDLYDEVLELKNGKKKTPSSTDRLKSSKKKAFKEKRQAKAGLTEIQNKHKTERQQFIDDIANLTMALFNAQRAKAELEIMAEHNVKKL
ncbi:hypothetical protein D3A87_09175 [Vibrio cholerae]|uniref:hypothetical protein n=1 Tax=Vibrio cholerae TaxID=666 RepID=UPI001E5F3D26|nr:hypothetical protein [Vibrio cholerae]MCD1167976.1 hypothetical protein [Vibrio cholerae]MCD1187752.1 hypothetical protein [Vibrio cholerae]HDZ9467601.1 hypothetical protein [Vibrio cholerae]HDZ9482660.1 hypothetical protein [Vibrio cholerae]HDZ9550066.1 hypothetical protein [Vibrio cholerae]